MKASFVEVAAVRLAVQRQLAALALAPNDLVLVACSGGADSLALASGLAYEANRVGRSTRSKGFAIRAGAVIVDHGLQLGSAEVATATATRCRALGLDPVLVRRVSVPQESGGAGPEGSARAARYAALAAVATALEVKAVLLGHTLDDQAEQVLLGLARGSGARALAGIPAARGLYRRPLLGLRRVELRAACAAQGLTWWDDPTNDLPEALAAGVPLRTRVRHELLPALEQVLGPGAAESLARSANQLRDDANALDELAIELLAAATISASSCASVSFPTSSCASVSFPTSSCASVSESQDPDIPPLALHLPTLVAAPRAIRTRALRLAALAVGAPASALNHRHVAALEALASDWAGQGDTFLPSGASAGRECDTLWFRRGPE
ncbi:MAG: tRNA lysidine(34) synthetase TilS [Promicromonosporaceae bacterium]|nr:tRNA lysidine(34) synthetase TilS [Promicromonosporaceae bacterium]